MVKISLKQSECRELCYSSRDDIEAHHEYSEEDIEPNDEARRIVL